MRAANVLHLGVKEIRSLARDPMMLVLIVFAFTFAVYASSTAMPETLNKAPISIVTRTGRRYRRASHSPSIHPISCRR